jgi:hypothetical protein
MRARISQVAPVEIAPPEARLEKVAGGFVFTEGPVWARAG